MSGPKRNPDRLNTIGVIVVGICGAVLVYVTIVALEAFYVNDTSEIQTMADYGGQDTTVRSLRASQMAWVTEYGTNPRPAAAKANEPQKPQTYRIPVDVAMKLVAEGARTDPSALIPALGHSDKATVLPIFGRPKLIVAPAPAAAPPGGAAPAGAPAAGTAPAGAGSGSAGSADLPAAPMVPTGAGTGPSPVGGAGALPAGTAPKPGTAPNPGGATPNPAGTPPNPAGTPPNPAGTPPNPAGTPPKAAGTPPKAAGTPPKAAGTPPKGNGK